MREDKFFEKLVGMTEPVDAAREGAPARVKAKIFSALIARQKVSGPLASLSKSKAAGHGLCVFEELVRVAPVGEELKHSNPCQVCHARVLAEHFENPPIFWPNCPYVRFQRR